MAQSMAVATMYFNKLLLYLAYLLTYFGQPYSSFVALFITTRRASSLFLALPFIIVHRLLLEIAKTQGKNHKKN
jgi:hypothetical protein